MDAAVAVVVKASRGSRTPYIRSPSFARSQCSHEDHSAFGQNLKCGEIFGAKMKLLDHRHAWTSVNFEIKGSIRLREDSTLQLFRLFLTHPAQTALYGTAIIAISSYRQPPQTPT